VRRNATVHQEAFVTQFTDNVSVNPAIWDHAAIQVVVVVVVVVVTIIDRSTRKVSLRRAQTNVTELNRTDMVWFLTN